MRGGDGSTHSSRAARAKEVILNGARLVRGDDDSEGSGSGGRSD